MDEKVIGKRIGDLREWMRGALVDAVMLTARRDIYYLSGFSGSAGVLLITPEEALLMSDGRYTEQARAESPLEYREYTRENRGPVLADAVSACGAQVLAYQDDQMTVREWHALQKRLPDMAFEPMRDVMLEMRSVKTDEEIQIVREAARITDAAFAEVTGAITEGMEEREVALMLDVAMRKLGADSMAFPPIVASGPQGALPHATPGKRRLQRGDLVVMDFGAKLAGYCADMTRTIGVGSVSGEAKALYALVLEAQQTALAALKSGVKGSDVDAVARRIFEREGYGDRFVHALGHGVGLAVHELPLLNQTDQGVLREGMLVTVEPGLYLPGKLGIRIEDLCVVEANGVSRLSQTPKDLMIV